MTTTQEYARTNETKTASRVYFVIRSWGKWYPYYQPLNPKTGNPWQASRRLSLWDGLETESEAVSSIAAEKEKSGK
jgi:hypothetical protein